MEKRLNELAVELEACRRRGNRMTLEHIVESARILEEARKIADGDFGTWLRTQGRMTRRTAERHMAVAALARNHATLMAQIATLSLAKLYALTNLDFELAAGYLKGEIRLSKPLDQLSDMEFIREFRGRHPAPNKQLNRRHVFQDVHGAIVRLRRKLVQGERFARVMSPAQQEKIVDAFQAMLDAAAGWKIVSEVPEESALRLAVGS